MLEIDEAWNQYTTPILGFRFDFHQNRTSQRPYKLYNAKQQCIKVSIFTDEAPYIINLSVGRHAS
jgi:hypothetical protein